MSEGVGCEQIEASVDDQLEHIVVHDIGEGRRLGGLLSWWLYTGMWASLGWLWL